MRESANECATLLCTPIANAICQFLPAELRNQVYDHLWDPLAIDLTDEQISRSSQEHSLSTDWVLKLPFFADASFVGEHFSREAAIYFLRVLTDSEVDYGVLQAYLRMKSVGNMDLRPGEIIRRLRIDVPYRTNPCSFAYADLKRNLESLLDLSVRNDLTVEVFLDRELQFSRNFFHIMDIIKPIYQTLVEKGMTIKVLGYRFFTPDWRQGVYDIGRPEPKQHCTTAEILNCYFDGTTEEWFAIKDAEIATLKNPRRREKCYQVRAAQERATIC